MTKINQLFIIQGDHGPDFSIPWKKGSATNEVDKYIETLNILNAYYFPNGSYDKIYNGITPVNSFRLIFNEFFEKNHDLLEDKQYFSGQGESVYDFLDVTKKLIVKLKFYKLRMNVDYDIIIIGAGVIGLSIARSLGKLGYESVLLIDKEKIGTGISSRSSEVIHLEFIMLLNH